MKRKTIIMHLTPTSPYFPDRRASYTEGTGPSDGTGKINKKISGDISRRPVTAPARLSLREGLASCSYNAMVSDDSMNSLNVQLLLNWAQALPNEPLPGSLCPLQGLDTHDVFTPAIPTKLEELTRVCSTERIVQAASKLVNKGDWFGIADTKGQTDNPNGLDMLVEGNFEFEKTNFFSFSLFFTV